MLSQADLARLAGVSRNCAGVWVKQGCPLTSTADATAWVNSRANPNGLGAPMVRIGAPPSYGPAGLPLPVPPPPSLGAPSESLSIEDMLLRVQRAEAEAGAEVAAAAPGSFEKSKALKPYSEAATNRIKMEEAILAILQQRRELLTPAQSEEVVSAAIRPIVAKLDTLAASLAHKVNPSDPELAMGILDEWAEMVKAAAVSNLTQGSAPAETATTDTPANES